MRPSSVPLFALYIFTQMFLRSKVRGKYYGKEKNGFCFSSTAWALTLSRPLGKLIIRADLLVTVGIWSNYSAQMFSYQTRGQIHPQGNSTGSKGVLHQTLILKHWSWCCLYHLHWCRSRDFFRVGLDLPCRRMWIESGLLYLQEKAAMQSPPNVLAAAEHCRPVCQLEKWAILSDMLQHRWLFHIFRDRCFACLEITDFFIKKSKNPIVLDQSMK